MQASPLKMHSREDCESSRKHTASGKLDAVITQKRGASAQRPQADHSGRESLMSSSSQEPRASGDRMQCFHQRAKNLKTSSRVLSLSTLTSILGAPFFKVMKIICSVRQDQNL